MLPDPDEGIFKKQLWLIVAVAVGLLGVVPVTVGYEDPLTLPVGLLPFFVMLIFLKRREKQVANEHKRKSHIDGFVETAFTSNEVGAAIALDKGDEDADAFLHPAGSGK